MTKKLNYFSGHKTITKWVHTINTKVPLGIGVVLAHLLHQCVSPMKQLPPQIPALSLGCHLNM